NAASVTFTGKPPAGAAVVVAGSSPVSVSGTLAAGETLWVRGNSLYGSGLARVVGTLINHGTLRLESVNSTWSSDLQGDVTNEPDGTIDVRTGTGGARTFTGTWTHR